jgi:hypothetical protein
MNEKLLRPQFDKLKLAEKLALMQLLAERYQMAFLSLYTFCRWGQSCTTGVFGKDGREFVFVPGATVTLGWEQFTVGFDKPNHDEMTGILEEIEYEGTAEDFIRQSMTPVRQRDIPPMLVGRELREIGWEPVSFWDDRLQEEHRDWLEDFWRHEGSGIEVFNIAGCAKFEKNGTSWKAYLYHKTTYRQFRESLHQQGFSLPTADQWAYLCGGGCRTLFPWGDGIDYKMHLHHFGDVSDPRPYDMEQPNFFGLSIACDPYMREVVEADIFTTCGGDGGCNICGGLGALLGYLPCSPHCKPEAHKEDMMDGDFDFYRPVILVELN